MEKGLDVADGAVAEKEGLGDSVFWADCGK